MKSLSIVSLILLLFSLSSCGPQKSESGAKDSTERSAEAPIDTSYLKDSAYYETLSKNPAPLTGGERSAEEVVKKVLDGLKKNDTTTLKTVLITRDEYFKILYPELGKYWPGARDMRPEIIEALWINQTGNSIKGLRRILRDLGGRELRLEKVDFVEGIKEYVSYRIHEGTTITIKDAEGTEYKISAIGSIVEKDGFFKLLSYRDQDGE